MGISHASYLAYKAVAAHGDRAGRLMARRPQPPLEAPAPPAAPPPAAPAQPVARGLAAAPVRAAKAPSSAGRKALHTAWPLAAVGTLSLLAGNPLNPPPTPSAAVPTSTAELSPTSYVAPDGRSFATLVGAHVLPDPQTTPSVLNPEVSPDTLKATVCKSGWTATVRPDVGITDKIKANSVPPGHVATEYELDHLLSIEDGGAPNDAHNLWMQVYDDPYGARTKDVLETKVKTMVCKGQLTLAQAQAALVPNWLVGFVKYVGPLPTKEP